MVEHDYFDSPLDTPVYSGVRVPARACVIHLIGRRLAFELCEIK